MGKIRAFEDLATKGFNVEAGIRLCGGDEEMYMEALWTAMEEGKKKIPLIRKAFEERNLAQYCKETSGLKEDMLSIGATYLSQLAAEQETAVKEENYAELEVGVEELLTQYQFVVDALKELLGEAM